MRTHTAQSFHTHGRGPTEAPRHRPLIPVFIGYVVGVAVDGWGGPPGGFWILLGLVTVGLGIWGVRRGMAPWGNWALAVLVVMPVGGAWHRWRFRRRAPHHLSRVLGTEGRRMRLRGRIEREPELFRWRRPFEDSVREKWHCRVSVRRIRRSGGRWQPAVGDLAVFGEGERPRVLTGDRVEMLAKVRANAPPTNPGEEDFRRIFERTGSFGTAGVSSGRAVRVLHRPGWYSSPSVVLGRLRGALKERLVWETDRRADALTAALIFGERGGLTRERWQLMAEAGSVHFLAISGLHVGIFAAFMWWVLLQCRVPVGWRSGVLIALVWLYVLFMGGQVSARRAAWMVSFLAAAPIFHRQSDPISALLGAGLLILAIRPQELFSAGFQFTFVAVWAIVFLYQEAHAFIWPWEEILERSQQDTERTFFDEVKVVFGHYLVLSICIWVALTPLSAHHFHRFSLLTPIINLLLWPLVLLLILSAFALVPLAMVSGSAAALLVELAGGLSSHIEALLEVARSVPGFAFYTPGPPGWWVAGCYLVICAWVVRDRLPRGRRVFLCGIVVLGLLYSWVDLGGRRADHLEFTLTDVGHGQCTVFRLPSGGCMLYDAGSSSPGRVRGVEGLLWSRRVRRIDALVVSHRDSDHCTFVPRLSHRFGIERILVAPLPPAREPRPIERTLRQVPAERTLLTQGAQIRAGDLQCTVLHPDAGFIVQGRSADNDRSVVMLCRYRGWRILLTGDVEGPAIRHLIVDHGKKLRADVLVLPHHGSWEPGLEQFLRAVRPRVALASNYREIDARTAAALRELDIPLWTTRSEGAITTRLTPDAVELTGYTSKRHTVWRRSHSITVPDKAGKAHARRQ